MKSSDKDPVKPADAPEDPIVTMSDLVAVAEGTPNLIACPFVGTAIDSYTVSEFEDSLETLDEESMEKETSEDSLVLSATLKQINRGEEGGYLLTLDVPECDRQTVANLLALGQRAFQVVLIP